MRCDRCPALLQEGYECPEYYCGLGEEEIFNSEWEHHLSTSNFDRSVLDAEVLEFEVVNGVLCIGIS